MANEKEPEPGTRGYRVNQIREELKLARKDLAPALAAVAEALKIEAGGEWTPSRVSRLILSRQPMSLDDAAVVVKLAESQGLKGRGWDWFVFGEPRVRVDIPDPRKATGANGGRRHQA